MMGLWLAVTILAAWRVTSLLARERGPFALGTRFRSLFGVHPAPDGKPAYDAEGELLLNPVTASARIDAVLYEIALGLTCMWCASVWVSLLLALVLAQVEPRLVFNASSYLLVVLATSAGVIVLESVRSPA